MEETKSSFNKTLGIRLSKVYLDGINILLDKGIYASKGEIVREGLRHIFEKNKLNLTDLKVLKEK
ncbi:MAG: hypothetical protein ACTSVY_04710 [Candidatus Helarchaeota archaeon]